MTRMRPILFSSPMVNAIIEGRKTQTRRILNPQPTSDDIDNAGDCETVIDMATGRDIRCPFGAEGDRLWVREAVRWEGGPRAIYEADNSACVIDTWPWKRPRLPGMFLPRGGSRITLEVTDVRVQRLQEISEEDARAEGVEPYTPPNGHISPDQRVPGPGFDRCRLGDQPHRLPFADLWDRINGKRAAWASNPWVWAITFRGLP